MPISSIREYHHAFVYIMRQLDFLYAANDLWRSQSSLAKNFFYA